ncbi:hypothetical protein GCM10010869_27630 [Mesorhizobium tianshanense]|nr:hypothetical protein GCM10010869_27630 [Mesorhizobium tianshanense]
MWSVPSRGRDVGLADVVQVDNRGRKKRRGVRRANRGFYKLNSHGCYNDHKGYKYNRPSYR